MDLCCKSMTTWFKYQIICPDVYNICTHGRWLVGASVHTVGPSNYKTSRSERWHDLCIVDCAAPVSLATVPTNDGLPRMRRLVMLMRLRKKASEASEFCCGVAGCFGDFVTDR